MAIDRMRPERPDIPARADIPRVGFLYLRHGETDWNKAGRAQGHSDIELNATGIAQALHAPMLLAGERIDRIVASPLARTRATARPIAEARGLPVIVDEALIEVCFGAREGEVMGDWYEAWLAGAETPRGGEEFSALVARASGAVARHLSAPGTTLFVAHGALFRAIRSALGLSNAVRLANGVPVRCAPAADGWSVLPVAASPVAD